MPKHLVIAPGLQGSIALAKQAWRSERPMLVVDCVGVGDRLEPHLQRCGERVGRAGWLDCGDRQRPLRLLAFSNSPADGATARRMLRTLAQVVGVPLSEERAAVAVAFAQRLAVEATDTWGIDTLASALAQPDLLAQAWPEPIGAARVPIDRLARVLAGMRAMPEAWELVAGRTCPDAQSPLPRLSWVELAARQMSRPAHRAQLAIVRAWVETVAHREPDRTVVYLLPPLAEHQMPDLPELPPRVHLCVAPADVVGVGVAWAAAAMGGEHDTLELQGSRAAESAETWSGWLGGDAAGRLTRVARQPVAFVRNASQWTAAVPRLLLGVSAEPTPVANLRRDARMLRTRARIQLPRADRGPFGVLGNLFDRLCSPAYLRQAWNRLILDGTSSREGVDGVRLKGFGDDIETHTERLGRELAENRYRALPPTYFTIPKTDGGERKIGLAAVRDRVVQRAFLDLVTPLFEPFFSEDSYGFRPNRGAHHALVRLLGHVRRGVTVLAQADVRRCFDTLPHDVILRLFAQRVPERRMLDVLDGWLRHGRGTSGLPDQLGIGVVQGWVLAPLLSNVVLDDLDQEMVQRGIPWLRYADDLAMPARSAEEARNSLFTAQELADTRLGLRFHPDKTSVRRFDEGWDYLGFRVGGGDVLAIAPDRLERSELSLATDVDAVAALSQPIAIGRAIRRVGLRWDGLTNYFARLGLTRAMGKQFDHLLAVIDMRRQRLPAIARDHGAWLQLADRNLIAERWGALATLPAVDPDAMSGSGYPEPPAAMDEPRAFDATQAPRRALPPALPDPNTAAFAVDGRSLRVLRGGIGLVVVGESLELRRKAQVLTRVLLANLDVVEVHAFGVMWSSQTTWQLAEAHVAVIVLAPCASSIAVLHTPYGGKPQVRAAQARQIGAPSLVNAAGSMLHGKIGNQAAVLRYLARAPARRLSEVGRGLRAAADEIRELGDALDSVVGDVSADIDARRARWMGYEGLAAARYWASLRQLIAPELHFESRIGRGAEDPINQALNFGYGLLYAEVWRAIARTGLDPGVGLIHLAPRSDGALVYDLVEELRAPMVDRLVWSLIGRGWEPTVAERNGQVLLAPRDRWIILDAWRRQGKRKFRLGRSAISCAQLPTHQARALQDVVLGKRETYPVYRFRW